MWLFRLLPGPIVTSDDVQMMAKAVDYRALQAQWNAKAEAMPRDMIIGRRRVVFFEYKQARRRAGGYAAQAARCEREVAKSLAL